MTNIRNFAIIAHIDHGKSTLADRLLELTGTISKEKLIPQYLDRLSLERERGITIKMQPVRMHYTLNAIPYTLNLIDTPGHTDFGYEVSRALKAVEGVVLLVDAAKGIQAQTVFNFRQAIAQHLVVIPAINKIDLKEANVERAQNQIVSLFASFGLEITPSDILKISAKNGIGTREILDAVLERIPPPQVSKDNAFQALVFDSLFDSFKGILAYVRMFQGSIKTGETVQFAVQGKTFQVKEVGIFTPDFVACAELRSGDIGYIATGIKSAGVVKIGDTIITQGAKALEGFIQPQPKVFASFYPLEEGEFDLLRTSLEKLQLSDPAISFERTESPLLGRGFRIGFLGKLHMEIVAGRLEQELNTEIVVGSPSVAYQVDGEIVTLPSQFPEHTKDKDIKEPWVRIEIFTPRQYLGSVMNLLQDSDGVFKDTTFIDEGNVKILFEMPLANIVTQDFYDKLKGVSSGFASAEYDFGEGAAKSRTKRGTEAVYEFLDWRKSTKVRLDIFVAREFIDAFSKIIERARVQDEAQKTVKKLKEILPQAQFVISLQASVEGRIIARQDIPALKKAVTAPLYGGDYTRKKKLLVKQREGKKRMRQFGRVSIPKEVFLKMA